MKHRFLYIMALLLTLATGAWAQDPDPIDLTPSADGTVWTLSTMPEYDVELEVTYYTDDEDGHGPGRRECKVDYHAPKSEVWPGCETEVQWPSEGEEGDGNDGRSSG